MLLHEPPQTDFDLHFSLGDIPVRVNPGFFVLAVIMGASTGTGVGLLIFIGVLFVSILVHELGHALVMKYFREPARIVLYWMGGLAISDGGENPWRISYRTRNRSELEQILISFAGPAAGFLLAGIVVLIYVLLGAEIKPFFNIVPGLWFDTKGTVLQANPYLSMLMWLSFVINYYLNLINLLPIFPMDGGQIARSLYVHYNPWQGIKYSLILSLVVAILATVITFSYNERFMGFFFAFSAIQNFQELQMISTGGFGGRRPW